MGLTPCTCAFLFDADDPRLSGGYGDACNLAVLQGLLQVDSAGELHSRVLTGDLLVWRQGERPTEVSIGEKRRSLVVASDSDRITACIRDVADSIAERWNTLNGEEFLRVLGTRTVCVVSLPSMALRFAHATDAALRGSDGYLGAVHVDNGNPLQRELLVDLLADHMFVKARSLYLQDDGSGSDPVDCKPWVRRAGLETLHRLEVGQYEFLAPPLLPSFPLSRRGRRTSELLEGFRPTLHERIGESLFIARSRRFPEDGTPRVFSTQLPPGVEKVIVSRDKLAGYVLDPEHANGGHKARLFRRLLGIESSDWEYLAAQLVDGLAVAELQKVRSGPFHIQYHADIPVRGRNGATAAVRTAWKVDSGDSVRLVTAYFA